MDRFVAALLAMTFRPNNSLWTPAERLIFLEVQMSLDAMIRSATAAIVVFAFIALSRRRR